MSNMVRKYQRRMTRFWSLLPNRKIHARPRWREWMARVWPKAMEVQRQWEAQVRKERKEREERQRAL